MNSRLPRLSPLLLVSALGACGSDGGRAAPEAPVASVTVTPATSTTVPGGTVQLEAVARSTDGEALTGREINWTSTDQAVATVSAMGLVSGVAAGNATITASSEGQSGTASVTVQVVAAQVVVSPARIGLAPAQSAQLAAAVLDADGHQLEGRPIQWTSSNAGVVSVSGSGLLTGVGDGTATITATAEGKTGSAEVFVSSVSIAGHYMLHEELSDPNLGYVCENFQDVMLVQSGAAFTGTSQQAGTCTIGGQTFDNSGTYAVNEGQIYGDVVVFTEPGAIPCVYEGTIFSPGMSGTVSCTGVVDGTSVNMRGTWCADYLGATARAARSGPAEAKITRIPSCT